jgi:hypothetical protein
MHYVEVEEPAERRGDHLEDEDEWIGMEIASIGHAVERPCAAPAMQRRGGAEMRAHQAPAQLPAKMNEAGHQ